MAKKALRATPARDRSREELSLLLRSAESLGRLIGSLQRQLDIATRHIAGGRAKTAGAKPVTSKRGGSPARRGTTVRGTTPKQSPASKASETSRRRSTTSTKKR